MSKSHRDNHAARVKIGDAAFEKKATRRAPPKHPKCLVCGTAVRPKNLTKGICQRCLLKV